MGMRRVSTSPIITETEVQYEVQYKKFGEEDGIVISASWQKEIYDVEAKEVERVDHFGTALILTVPKDFEEELTSLFGDSPDRLEFLHFGLFGDAIDVIREAIIRESRRLYHEKQVAELTERVKNRLDKLGVTGTSDETINIVARTIFEEGVY